MKDDAFEKKLRALTAALHRPDPTPAWKADILARARREAEAAPIERSHSQRWLVATLGVAWAAIFAMHFTTPDDASRGGMRDVVAAKKTRTPDTFTHGESWTLLAFHNRMNPNLELPQ